MFFEIFVVILSTIVFIGSYMFGYVIFRCFDTKYKRLIPSNEDKAVLITGCDTGLGLEIAKHLYLEHNFTLICCCLDSKSLGYEQLNKLKQSKNDNLTITTLDVTESKQIQKLEDLVNELKNQNKFKYLWAVINNSAVMIYGEFDWMTQEQIERQMNVNLLGTMLVTKALLPHILQAKGRIINISSVSDTLLFPGTSVYAATKSAISTFTKTLGYEIKKFGCHAICFRPGDLAKLTSIMSRHRENSKRMWEEMNESKRKVYENYFPIFNDKVCENFGSTSPTRWSDCSIFDDIGQALMLPDPPSVMTSAKSRYKIIYILICLVPIRLYYLLLDFIISTTYGLSPKMLNIKG